MIRLGFGGLGIRLLGDDVLLFFLLLIQRFYGYTLSRESDTCRTLLQNNLEHPGINVVSRKEIPFRFALSSLLLLPGC